MSFTHQIHFFLHYGYEKTSQGQPYPVFNDITFTLSYIVKDIIAENETRNAKLIKVPLISIDSQDPPQKQTNCIVFSTIDQKDGLISIG